MPWPPTAVHGPATLVATIPATAFLLLLSPLVEETLFRHGLQRWALHRGGPAVPRAWWVPSGANTLVALCFAAAHLVRLPPHLAVATIVPALLIGLLYERTQRLWPCVLLHALFNLLWLAWS
jgi:membrane protease YdiL (CAAX protease family)